MGNGDSRSNDSMIDQLVTRGRVVSRNVERAFRLVDRGCFLPAAHREAAYSSVPFRMMLSERGVMFPGALHLSTIDVYSDVFHHLDLRKGQSFLNVGSGSGYLSTVAGILLGDNGVNHGIELYPNLIDYADARFQKWSETPGACSVGWARPLFKACDIFNAEFLRAHTEMYDRVYISFVIVDPRLFFRVLRMLKVGGVLVAPTDDNLCRYVRISGSCCSRQTLSSMHFTRAIRLTDPEELPKGLPIFESIPTLAHLARQSARRRIRKEVFNRSIINWMSRTMTVKKGGMDHYTIPRPRNSNRSRPMVELRYPPRNPPPPIDRRRRPRYWVNGEVLPETSSRSNSTMSIPHSPAAASDISSPDSDWAELEERGEGLLIRELHSVMEVFNPERANIVELTRIMRNRPMGPPPPEPRRGLNNNNNNHEGPQNPREEPLVNDPSFIEIVDRERGSSPVRPSGNLTDEEKESDTDENESDDEEYVPPSPPPKFAEVGTPKFAKWLAADPQTEDEPNYSDYDLDEPSTSSAPPPPSKKGNTSTKKRSIQPNRGCRNKRCRYERDRNVDDLCFDDDEEPDSKRISELSKRDNAIASGHVIFQARLQKLPLPPNLKTFLQDMRHDVAPS